MTNERSLLDFFYRTAAKFSFDRIWNALNEHLMHIQYRRSRIVLSSQEDEEEFKAGLISDLNLY